MDNQIVCKDVIVVDNIKSEFYLYFTKNAEFKELHPRYKYYLYEQELKLRKHYLNLFTYDNGRGSIMDRLKWSVYSGKMPKRYLPKEEIVDKKSIYTVGYTYRKDNKSSYFRRFKSYSRAKNFMKVNQKRLNYLYGIAEENIEVWRLVFKESIISLMIQNDLDKDIINLFKEITQRDKGISFDDYINKWAKELIKEVEK